MNLTPPLAHRGSGRSRVEVTLTSMQYDSATRPHLYVRTIQRVLLLAVCHGTREGEQQEALDTSKFQFVATLGVQEECAFCVAWAPAGKRWRRLVDIL